MEDKYSVKIRLEHSSRSQTTLMIISSVVLFIISLILALTVTPGMIKSKTIVYAGCGGYQVTECISTDGIQLLDLKVIDLNNFNQFLYLEMQPNTNKSLHTEINFNYTLLGLENDDEIKWKTSNNENITIHCTDDGCDSSTIFYVPFIFYSSYSLSLQINDNVPVDSIDFKLKYMNRQYTIFELGVKSFFLLISIISYTAFLCSIRRVPLRF